MPPAHSRRLSIGERQMISILQALGTGADLVVLDDPTASLAAEERELVHTTIRRLSEIGNTAILFVSHVLDEVIALADQVTVLLFTSTNGFNMLNLGANWKPLIQGAVINVAAAIYTVGKQHAKGG